MGYRPKAKHTANERSTGKEHCGNGWVMRTEVLFAYAPINRQSHYEPEEGNPQYPISIVVETFVQHMRYWDRNQTTKEKAGAVDERIDDSGWHLPACPHFPKHVLLPPCKEHQTHRQSRHHHGQQNPPAFNCERLGNSFHYWTSSKLASIVRQAKGARTDHIQE